MMDTERLSFLARISSLKMVNRAKSAHIGSSLSVIDIASVLFGKISPPDEPDNVVIFSKGHAAAGIYATMAHAGFFSPSLLENYCENGSELGGHISYSEERQIPLSTGSLGHGFPFGVGIALNKKLEERAGRVFIVLSDGECDEGTTWESALLSNHFELENLVVIIDRNHIQSLGATEETLRLEPLAEKWEKFGWKTISVDGHDHFAIENALSTASGPICIIAETIKGKGVSFMEGNLLWHYRPPNDEELNKAITEIESNNL